MTKVSILPIPTEGGDAYFCAIAGDKQTIGATVGKALDALYGELGDEEGDTLIIVQNRRADRFFGGDKQRRVTELMEHWRELHERGAALPPDQQEEIEALVEEELIASGERASAMLAELAR